MDNNNFVKYHIACDKCGSSDARSVNKNGSSYCFSCNTYFPPEQTNINEGDTMGIQAVQTKQRRIGIKTHNRKRNQVMGISATP